MSETKYQNFEIMIMDTKILKEELIKELKKKRPDETYIEEILTYGAWGDEIEWFNKETTTIEKAFKLLHDNESMALPFLVGKGYLYLVKLLFKDTSIDPNVQNSKGKTALMIASEQGCPQVVQLLLSHPKINPNLKNKDGETVLHLATLHCYSQGHTQVVRELLNHPKINPNLKNSSGDTALIWASERGYSQVVQALLSHPKTNPNLKNEDGRTAFHYASKKGHSQVVEELLKHPKIKK